jgi:hypothetical protein
MTSLLQDRIGTVGQLATNRLDRIADLVPQTKPPKSQPSFEDYMKQATVVAQRDPAFKARLEQALAQYRQVAQEVENAQSKR